MIRIIIMAALVVNTGIFRDKTMADKSMYIPNGYKQNNPFVDQNYWLKS